MPATPLKRAERAIERIREQAELPPELAMTLEEIVQAVRDLQGRLTALESKARINPTAEMSLPNRR